MIVLCILFDEAGELSHVGLVDFNAAGVPIAAQRLKQRRDAGDDIRLLLDEQFGIGIDVELRDKDAACA